MKKSMSYFLFIFLSMSIFYHAAPIQALQNESVEKIAVLPFETNSLEDISFIRQGITRMLYSRLSWKDRIKVEEIDDEIDFIDTRSGRPDKNIMMDIAQKNNARYVLLGTITHFSGAFSLDVQIFDIQEEKETFFFEQAKTVDKVIPELNKLAARINKDVFNRTTAAYREIENKQTQHEQQLQRIHPESMMPQRPHDDTDKPWWKIW